MMKKAVMSVVVAVCLAVLPAGSAQAQDAAVCENRINIEVNGLVCDFCARAIEKLFGKRAEVEKIIVDLNNGHITVETKPDQNLEDELVKKLVTDSGYDVTALTRGC